MTKSRVALIHNIISPYRVPLFVALSNHPSIDLHVYYSARRHKIRLWEIREDKGYRYEVMRGLTLEISSFIYHVNPAIVERILNGEFDCVILGGDSDFTTQIALVLAKIVRIPVVLWSEGIEESQSSVGRLGAPIRKWIARSVDAIIVPGTRSRDYFSSLGAIQAKIFVAPNTVDNEKFKTGVQNARSQKEALKKQMGLDGTKVILYVGRLVKSKGIDYLIQAYKSLCIEKHDLSMMIVGDGEELEALKKKCSDEDISGVFFTGWLEDERIRMYAIADVFALPTLRDVWGLVVNEAMLSELPIVVTRAAGCSSDMVRPGENGFIIDPGSTSQLAAALSSILYDEDLRMRMGRRSLEIVNKDFSLDKILKEFVSAIDYAIRSKRY